MNVRHLTGPPPVRTSMAALREGTASVLLRPSLWWPAVSAAARFAAPGWWHRPPFLPVPDDRYWRFRMETAYGDESAHVGPDDLDDALRWAHRAHRRRR